MGKYQSAGQPQIPAKARPSCYSNFQDSIGLDSEKTVLYLFDSSGSPITRSKDIYRSHTQLRFIKNLIMRSLHWEESDIVTLLGWLNYCVANGDNFWQSIVAHLQESRRLNSLSEHDFTKIQIRNKLIGVPRERILKHSSNKPFPKLADLLSRGTACIPGLSPPTTAKINDEVVKFKKRYKRHNTPERSNNEGDVVSTDCSAIHTPTISVSLWIIHPIVCCSGILTAGTNRISLETRMLAQQQVLSPQPHKTGTLNTFAA